ncbi:porin family protein [Seonamhaeicola sp. MEBiC1930]|uniref:outer membrane beta-barrel protein n=1 Tax=Seonamhaeicola sp. MEBiC01930 TaxID=2976768 RepID=UPI00324A2FAE
MKDLISLISILFIALMVTSCVSMQGGVCNTDENISFNSSESVVATTGLVSKAVSKSSNAINSLVISETGSSTGFYLLAQLEDVEIGDKFEFRPGLGVVVVEDLNQIYAPLKVSYEFAEKFKVLAGPNLGYLLDDNDGIKSLNLSAGLGLSYDISEDIYISGNYDFGLTDLTESEFSDLNLNNLFFGIGYKF